MRPMGGWKNRHNDAPQEPEERTPEEMEHFRKMQVTVATSTFTALTCMGIFCTCIYFLCYRPKRQSRIHGRTWHTHHARTYGLPGNAALVMNGLPAHLNPYMVDPRYYQQDIGGLNLHNGLYNQFSQNEGENHEMSTVGPYAFTEDTKGKCIETQQGQEDAVTNNTISQNSQPSQIGSNSVSNYKPFFAKMDWEPPKPPAYDSGTSGYSNPVYNDHHKDPSSPLTLSPSNLIQGSEERNVGSEKGTDGQNVTCPENGIAGSGSGQNDQECQGTGTGSEALLQGLTDTRKDQGLVETSRVGSHEDKNIVPVTSVTSEETPRDVLFPPPYNPNYAHLLSKRY